MTSIKSINTFNLLNTIKDKYKKQNIICYNDFNLIRNKYKHKIEELIKKDFKCLFKEGLFDITRSKYFINNKVEYSYLDYVITANLYIIVFPLKNHQNLCSPFTFN